MSVPIRLQEWGDRVEVELPFERLDLLRKVAGNALDITPGSLRDHWSLRANSYCGSIRVDDLVIHIRPKIPLDNLFYMLTAGQMDMRFGSALTGYEQDDLMPALARFYERLMADTLQRGVLKAYKQHEESLVALHGRIDMPAVIRGGGIPSPIPCRFDELTIDIPENQILDAAANILVSYPEVAPKVRQSLRRTSGILDGVSSVDRRQPPAVHLTRLNRYYEPALRLAQVVLASSGLRDRQGSFQASTFLINMNRLFERFVTEQLRRRLAGWLEVKDQVLTHLDIGGQVRMFPDLIFSQRGRPVLVADIKYKLTDDGLGRDGDYYQLLAYCDALQIHKGLLLYSAEAGIEATVVRVVSDGPALQVLPLDLAGDRPQIEAALVELANAIYVAR